ncbi:hypothetical protein KFE25_009963 [Diacronema lutheri]|uniref:N-acetyltransferase domain-containing protein n=1 Tax=Diacronema lutheri TaxID=2081491 RepID=A0A8J5XJK7_DIALT|nr:hypothetical protein KFE25_009963 [Diacronema lutheri]
MAAAAWPFVQLIVILSPGLANVGVTFGARGYSVGQVCGPEALAASGVINRCFFEGSQEGPHKVELIANALRTRMGTRLQAGGIQHNERSSLVLGVVPDAPGGAGPLIAVAELSMQPRNGQVPGNFRPPCYGGTEPMVPYICNLAVDHGHRKRGIARELMLACEVIILNVWGFGECFLHVDERNLAAAKLYSSLGYEPLPHWDAPRWKEKNLGLVPFRYHRKVLSRDPNYVVFADEVDRNAAAQRQQPVREPTLGFVA